MLCIVCYLLTGCRHSNCDHTTVETVDGITIKTFYTPENNVELQLISFADSFYVGRPTENVSKAEISGGMWKCVNLCRRPGGPINTDCLKRCLKKIVVTKIE